MSKLLFTSSKTPHSIGYIGGGAEHIPLELMASKFQILIPIKHICLLFILTFYLKMYSLAEIIISCFISIEEHALGGVKDLPFHPNILLNCQDDLILLNDGFEGGLSFMKGNKLSTSKI